MLYELKNVNGIPVLFMEGEELLGTNFRSISGAKDWVSMLCKGEELDEFMNNYESQGYARVESKPVPQAELRTQFDTPEQKARYIDGVTAILKALRKK